MTVTTRRRRAARDRSEEDRRGALRLVVDRAQHGASRAEACAEARAYLRSRAAHPAGTHTGPGDEDEVRLISVR